MLSTTIFYLPLQILQSLAPTGPKTDDLACEIFEPIAVGELAYSRIPC